MSVWFITSASYFILISDFPNIHWKYFVSNYARTCQNYWSNCHQCHAVACCPFIIESQCELNEVGKKLTHSFIRSCTRTHKKFELITHSTYKWIDCYGTSYYWFDLEKVMEIDQYHGSLQTTSKSRNWSACLRKIQRNGYAYTTLMDETKEHFLSSLVQFLIQQRSRRVAKTVARYFISQFQFSSRFPSLIDCGFR